MARRRLILMRHAETDYFAEPHIVHSNDTPLTGQGRVQARAAAVVLEGLAFDRVVTSGTLRTMETARIVVGDRFEPIESWAEFREIESGSLASLSSTARNEVFDSFLKGVAAPDSTLFGGETVGELLDRITSTMERLQRDDTWKSILLVSHGVANRAILSWALMNGKKKVLFGNLEQAFACINIVDFIDHDLVVRLSNYCPYDPLFGDDQRTTMERLRAQFRDSGS
ncbi:histidine phosphatase family protein [Streptosporangiaceae bacterium NEAU-GS5]|nr:histidine phosphatase family protein [Streptosporangiaceae bacterium NEAU-GS5]